MRRGTKTGPRTSDERLAVEKKCDRQAEYRWKIQMPDDLLEKGEAAIALGIRFENESVAKHVGVLSEEKARAILAVLAEPERAKRTEGDT